MPKVLVPAAAALAFVSFAVIAADSAQTPQKPVTVKVDVRCGETAVKVTVDPWDVLLQQGDEVEWLLDRNAHSHELTITNKRGAGGWPFTNSPPYKGGRSNPPQGRGMKRDQAGNRYRYNIELTCSYEGSGPYDVVIDPAMIIRG